MYLEKIMLCRESDEREETSGYHGIFIFQYYNYTEIRVKRLGPPVSVVRVEENTY